MNYNAFCYGEKKTDSNPFLVQFCCLHVTWDRLYLQHYRPRKSIKIDLLSFFLNAGASQPKVNHDPSTMIRARCKYCTCIT